MGTIVVLGATIFFSNSFAQASEPKAGVPSPASSQSSDHKTTGEEILASIAFRASLAASFKDFANLVVSDLSKREEFLGFLEEYRMLNRRMIDFRAENSSLFFPKFSGKEIEVKFSSSPVNTVKVGVRVISLNRPFRELAKEFQSAFNASDVADSRGLLFPLRIWLPEANAFDHKNPVLHDFIEWTRPGFNRAIATLGAALERHACDDPKKNPGCTDNETIRVDKCSRGYEFRCSNQEPQLFFPADNKSFGYFEIKPKIIGSTGRKKPGDGRPIIGEETIDFKNVKVWAFTKEPPVGPGSKQRACKYEFSIGNQNSVKSASGNEPTCASDQKSTDSIMPKIQLDSLIRYCRRAASFDSRHDDTFKCSDKDSAGQPHADTPGPNRPAPK
jgi:hypothetical protein